VAEATAVRNENTGEGFLTGVTEGSMSEVVAEGYCLSKVFVEAQRPSDGARDLHHLQRMRQTGAEVIAVRGDEDLRLMHQTTEGLCMDDSVAVSLEVIAYSIRGLRT
jgi:hypothetical protein